MKVKVKSDGTVEANLEGMSPEMGAVITLLVMIHNLLADIKVKVDKK